MSNGTVIDNKVINRAKFLSLLALIVTIAGSVGVDQVTKYAAEEHLMIWQHEENLKLYQGRPYYVWATAETPPNRGNKEFYFYFGFNYVRNQGAAWGVLSDMRDSIRVPFFYGMTVLAVIIILFYLKVTPYGHRLARFALALILSGAIGNFLDRVRVGYVIDWIDVRWNIWGWYYHFPNFNVADSCISVGVFLLLVDSLVLEAVRKRKLQAAHASSVTHLPQESS